MWAGPWSVGRDGRSNDQQRNASEREDTETGATFTGPDGDIVLRDVSFTLEPGSFTFLTGPSGAGKSTLCDRLIALHRSEGKTVGVIAVDPSSPVTGGAILGDRIRMQQHHDDSGVFIRSMATRGTPGGLARATRGLVTLLDAASFDVVIIETVGVGQSEVDVANLAQVTMLVMAPGAGDDIQTMKAGVLEVADPYGGPARGYEAALDLIEAGCKGLLESLKPLLDQKAT